MKRRVIFLSLLICAVTGSLVVGMGVPRAQEPKADNAAGQHTSQKGDNEKTIQEFNRGTITLMVIDASGNTATVMRNFP
jgi:hypothetical protein